MVINPVSWGGVDAVCFGLPQQAQDLGFVSSNDHGVVSSSPCGRDSFPSPALSQSLAAQLEKQRQELDCFLQLQNQRLRLTLQHQRNQQLAVLFNGLESKFLSLMRQKEEDLAQATKRAMVLQDYLRRAEMESESWETVAKEKEAMVVDLNSAIERVKERLVLATSGTEDAESCCCGSSSGQHQDSHRDQESTKMACKSCNTRSSSVLFLPCRHLCSCKSCEAFLGSCPVCKSVKEATMEVFFG